MKKIVIFALFCVLLIFLMPMVSSIETKLVENDIEDKIDDLFLKKRLLVNLFKNTFDLFIFKDIINTIFLMLLLPIFYLIFYISIWGDWSYFDIITFINLYFSIISYLFENILEIIFGIN